MAQQNLTLQARGLWLTSNQLDAPPGSLSNAKNAVIRRRGVVEPRRGQEPDATVPSSAYVDAMASFEGELITHASNDKLGIRTNSTTVTNYSGTYAAPTGAPVRFVESAGGLYATTSTGLVRLDSPAGAWTSAGVPPGLEGKAAAASGTSGWIDYGETVGYRLVWGRRDGDGQLMLGAPSGRILYTATDAAVAASLTRTAGTTVTATTSSAHGLATGNTIELVATADATNFPLLTTTITVTGATTFTYAQAGANVSSTGSYMLGGSTRDVAITSPIPSGIDPDDGFLQVYRTLLTTTSSNDPGEDMALVGEFFPTPADVSAGVFTVTDIASFANGATAYFSPSLGIGLSGAKLPPPLLTDAVVFNGYTFGVVQEFQQSATISLLATDGVLGLGTLDGIALVDSDAGVTERFVANNALAEGAVISTNEWAFKWFSSSTPGQDIENTARSLVRVINLRSSYFYAVYASGPSEIPGQIVLSRRANGVTRPVVRAINNGKCWAPALRMYFDATLTRAANVVNANVAGPHPAITFAAGDRVVLYDSTNPNFPDGSKTITSAAGADFTWSEVGANVGVGVPSTMYTDVPDLELVGTLVPGSYAFSDFEEPDSWPPRFRFQVGGPNSTLYRIIPQGNALLFFTSDGLFRLTGRTDGEFVLLPVDPTVKLVGPKTAVSMGNRAFALTNQGVLSITDLGVEKVSEPVDLALLPYYAGELAPLTEDAAFGVGYQTENEYTLFLQAPDASAGDPPDRAYTYNTQTGTWVGPWVFSWSGINSSTNEVHAAHVNAADGRLYISAGDRLTRERKSRSLTDYQDATGAGIPVDVATTVNTASSPGAYKQWVESTVLLEQPQPSSVELYFTTELDSTEEGGTIPSQGNGAVRTYIPQDKSRSARLTVGVRHEAPQEKLTILGVQTVANVSSTRVGR